MLDDIKKPRWATADELRGSMLSRLISWRLRLPEAKLLVEAV